MVCVCVLCVCVCVCVCACLALPLSLYLSRSICVCLYVDCARDGVLLRHEPRRRASLGSQKMLEVLDEFVSEVTTNAARYARHRDPPREGTEPVLTAADVSAFIGVRWRTAAFVRAPH